MSELEPREGAIEDLVDRIGGGDARYLARALSMVENGHEMALRIMHSLYDPERSGLTVGITGPPGSGKSTLTGRLIGHWRGRRARVGVIAVDPSSPFSGGALLGDRVRMQDHATDPGVFIRSMGSRGHLGGVAGSTRDALEVMSAAGYDPVLVETVGVGQAEVEIASLADVTLLVLVPGFGDEVQALKAGIMEIADIIVLNKSDRRGIDQLETAVRASLELLPDDARKPPVVRCSAATGDGIDELTAAVDAKVSGIAGGRTTARRRASLVLESIIRERGREMASELVSRRYGSLENAIDSILRGETTPYGIGGFLSECPSAMAGDP